MKNRRLISSYNKIDPDSTKEQDILSKILKQSDIIAIKKDEPFEDESGEVIDFFINGKEINKRKLLIVACVVAVLVCICGSLG